MEVLGRVKLINPVQQVSASFKKELAVTTERAISSTHFD